MILAFFIQHAAVQCLLVITTGMMQLNQSALKIQQANSEFQWTQKKKWAKCEQSNKKCFSPGAWNEYTTLRHLQCTDSAQIMYKLSKN